MGLTKLALTRPVLIFMVMFACFLLGNNALKSMRVEENPEVEFGVVQVTTTYPGAGPDEMNTLVSRKIEEAVSGVNGMYEVTAISQEGVSIVVCRFDIGTNMNNALNDVRSKVDQTVGNLPRGALKPTVSKTDTASSPV
ncbi:MAG: efflux RND transporter permease subunit, partial [Armatimonadetes bacterium]|nr:efflux RND transporter permease subunit [Armatimonadota bacterium]